MAPFAGLRSHLADFWIESSGWVELELQDVPLLAGGPPAEGAGSCRCRQRPVAALPYGDLDVAAVLGGPLRALYTRAAGLSAATMPGYGVAAPLPVVAPTSGYLPQAALRRLDAQTPVLLGEAALPDTRSTVLERDGQAPLLRTDAAAASGGPDPAAPYDALGVRQRLLAESALHALSPQRRQPLVVSLPAGWDPGSDWASSRVLRRPRPALAPARGPALGALAAARSRPAGSGPRLVYPTLAAGGRGAGVQPRHDP